MTLKQKVTGSVFILFITILGLFLSTFWVSSSQKDDGLVINLAGRQRMLTQKMTKEILHFHATRPTDPEGSRKLATRVRTTMTVFDMTLKALTDAGPAPLGLDPETSAFRDCPAATEPVYSQLIAVAATWQEFQAALEGILHTADADGAALQWVMANNMKLLKQMNQAVGMMQAQSEKKVRLLLVVQTFGILIGSTVLFFFLFIVMALARQLDATLRRVRSTTDAMAGAATSVATSSQTLANATGGQAAALEESAASIEEMTGQTRENAENAAAANTRMQEGRAFVETAASSMEKLTASMEAIAKASGSTAEILRSIDEIAFQTNLLALNAAVEAARAGEAGAGFAVVADEVRRLALRAAEAAKLSGENIDETLRKVEEGSQLVTATGREFSGVSDVITKVAGLVNGIASATNEQADGIEQISRAVADMDRNVQSTVSVSEDTARAATDMSHRVDEMRDVIRDLIRVIRGSSKNNAISPSDPAAFLPESLS